MKISELITALENVKAQRGDLRTVVAHDLGDEYKSEMMEFAPELRVESDTVYVE